MYLCDNHFNLTLVFYTVKLCDFIYISKDEKEVKGVFGELIFRPIRSKKSRP